MKKTSILIVTFVYGFLLQLNAQTIRRVNNTPGLNDPNVYTTLQAAHDAADPGDIISLEPSVNPNYGEGTIIKTVHIVGPGYYLDKNPNTFFDKRVPSVGGITFENGSQNSSITSVAFGGVSINAENIKVERCLFHSVNTGVSGRIVSGSTSTGNGSIIKNNIFRYIFGSGGGSSNMTITNNIIVGFRGLWLIENVSNSIISYNTFGAENFIYQATNSTITNNIFDARALLSGATICNNCLGSSISNNLCTNINGLPSGSGNINGVNPSTIFLNGGNPWGYDYNGGTMYAVDNDFQLAPNSPAKTAAAGGGEAGAFGNGANAYRLSGLPKSPIITSFTNTGSGSNTTPLSITISVRSNN
ncbi:hypothetical protein [Emticicia sp. BO119]|uniref:hypothetical protein n=1 Tax=Emticicia sp. BO119 TaxID=2757768 RepID=UPI0015F114EA|nr:hypothetical protein [Emticicia sp. BO119]MBA4850282.1 hypothetical protein [Emticicia sp. BO119]